MDIAKQIAKAHLVEDKDYYRKLYVMEHPEKPIPILSVVDKRRYKKLKETIKEMREDYENYKAILPQYEKQLEALDLNRNLRRTQLLSIRKAIKDREKIDTDYETIIGKYMRRKRSLSDKNAVLVYNTIDNKVESVKPNKKSAVREAEFKNSISGFEKRKKFIVLNRKGDVLYPTKVRRTKMREGDSIQLKKDIAIKGVIVKSEGNRVLVNSTEGEAYIDRIELRREWEKIE